MIKLPNKELFLTDADYVHNSNGMHLKEYAAKEVIQSNTVYVFISGAIRLVKSRYTSVTLQRDITAIYLEEIHTKLSRANAVIESLENALQHSHSINFPLTFREHAKDVIALYRGE
jgi:hypothetical protein